MQHFSSNEINALYQCLADSYFIVIAEPDGQIRKVNTFLSKTLQYELFELVGQPIGRIIHCNNNEPICDDFSAQCVTCFTQNGYAEWRGNINFITRTGGEVWCHGFSKKITDPETGQLYQILVAIELAEYRALTQSLLYTEQMLNTLMNSAPVGIAHTDINSNIIFVNEHWCELSEREAQQMVGQPWYYILDEEHQNIISQQWLAFMSSGITGNLKHFSRFRLMLPKSGKERWVLVSLSSVQQKNHNLTGYIFSIQDITQQVVVERAMQAAKTEAEYASRCKSEFLTNVSHEIRTPMNGILGMAEVALNTDLKPDQKRYLNLIMSSGRSLLSMLNEVLDFSKIEAGKLELSPIPFKLRESLDEIIRLFVHKAYENKVELLYKIDEDIPNDLLGDITRIRQVMANLINNAVKFTQQGHVMVYLHQAARTGNTVRLGLKVEDSGIGISAEQLDRIFEPFTQADNSTSRRFGGTGLGLTITRQLLELMNGFIEVNSQPGVGSQFYCEWEVELNPDPNEHDNWQPAQLHVLEGLKVLVADDSAASRHILHDVLAAWQMQPVLMDNGAAVLPSLQEAQQQQAPFALVLLDVEISQLDGFQIARQIKALPELAATKIVMLPSFAEVGQGTQCRQLGIEGYLTKPVSQQELLQCLLALFSPDAPKQLMTRHILREQGQLLRVLVVEDDETNRFYINHCLRQAGCEVLLAATADEARQFAKSHLLDIILMDLNLPDTDGISLTKELRLYRPLRYIPIVAVTANAYALDAHTLQMTGLDGVVHKPFASDVLIRTIRQVVTEYQHTQHFSNRNPSVMH